MKRRNLLRGALAAGLTAPALTALTAARTDIVQTLSPDAPQNLADLVGDFTALRPLLTVPQPAPVRTRLCHTAGQMAGMTAIVLHDLGSRRESRAWFATAARVAIESGDDQLHAWVLAREAMVPLNYRDEVRSVAFSADGRLLASAGGAATSASSSGTPPLRTTPSSVRTGRRTARPLSPLPSTRAPASSPRPAAGTGQ
ncbi:hypothetical protein ABTY20_26885 [Streptomyces sp. NPDC126497]|uniref:hypothetical protein n=1 Tax=Streptomyces sp. NPDC126497 TaxID=3155313 RepID=UPI0033330E4D